MTANSAILARIYPNSAQKQAIEKWFVDCVHWYNLHLEWYLGEYEKCKKPYMEYCEANPGASQKDKNEYWKTIGGPANNKMGWPKRITNIDQKFKDRYGECKMLSSMNEFVEDALGVAIKKVKDNQKKGKRSKLRFKSVLHGDANSCTIDNSSDKKLKFYFDADGNVTHFDLPIRKKSEFYEIRKIKCRLSERLLETSIAQTAVTITKNSCGEYFASIRVEQPSTKERVPTGIECGIDIGIKDTLVLAKNADGHSETKTDHYEKHNLDIKRLKKIEDKIAFLQQKQSERIEIWMNEENKRREGTDLPKLSLHGKGDKSATKQFYIRQKTSKKSRRFESTQKRLAQLALKAKNIRKDFYEKETHRISRDFDRVGIETLSVSDMVKRRLERIDIKEPNDNNEEEKEAFIKHKNKMSKAILRVGFGMFSSILKRKLAKERIILADKVYASTQTCSNCHRHIDEVTKIDPKFRKENGKSITLGCREWTCGYCGAYHDRDENAASNLRPSVVEETLKIIAEQKKNKKKQKTGVELKVKRAKKSSVKKVIGEIKSIQKPAENSRITPARERGTGQLLLF